jgi:DNA-binding GntR family transcriptional regulator
MDTEPLAITVDRASPVPLYYQVAQQLEKAIGDGRLAPGTKLDNEIALAGRLRVSRPTMRRAIQELVGKGLLARRRGLGTQVVHDRLHRELGLTSLYDDLTETGQEPRTRVLVNRLERAPGHVAGQLRIEPESRVVYLERLRLVGAEPLAVMRNWLPEWLLRPSDHDLETRGLYELLRASGIRLVAARQRMGACRARAHDARLLGEARSAPLLTMQRTSYDDSGRVAEFADHAYRPAIYSFEITLVNRY